MPCQGSLDGLCGQYAIINAFQKCGIEDEESLFRAACLGIAKSRWPKILWEGTSLRDLMNMINCCKEIVPGVGEIAVRYPFSRNEPINNDDYWRKFDAIFENELFVSCAILGVSRPFAHWIVAWPDGGRVQFLDCDPNDDYPRKNRASLYAGSRNADQGKWLIDRREFVLFSTSDREIDRIISEVME